LAPSLAPRTPQLSLAPRLVIHRPVHGRSPVLVDTARLLRSTPVWSSGAFRLVVLLRSAHGQSLVLIDIARLLHGAPVWLFGAARGTLVHVASVTAVAALDAMVQGVGPTVPRRLPQLDGTRSPHAYDRLGGRLRRHQSYPTPPRSHLTQTSFVSPPFLHHCR
jgi:hypothetical protein